MSKGEILQVDSFSQDMTRNFYWGVCVDNEDPLMIGRVRVKPLIKNVDQVEKSAIKKGFKPDSTSPTDGPWSPKDPYVYLAFLPYFINQVPKPTERVMILYFDRKRTTGRNKFYMVGPFSSPMTILEEDYRSSKSGLDDGYDNSLQSIPNIKNTGGAYADPSKRGVFAEPIDISIQGRDTADIIIKKDDILLRAGKHFEAQRGEVPAVNNHRAFLQLSKLDKIQKFGEPETFKKLVDRKDQLKYLIEYYCTTMNSSVGIFSGGIRIIQLPTTNSYETQVGFFDYDTTLTGQSSYGIVYNLNVQALSFDDFKKTIVGVIKQFHTDPTKICDIQKDSQFPFYYRPNEQIRNLLTDLSGNIDLVSIENMGRLINDIMVTSTDLTPGYGLVYKGFKTPLPYDEVNEVIIPVKFEKSDNTVATLGADQLYLLSHKTSIPGKDSIVLDESIYGITGNTFTDIIEPNTSSMVRGEELMELLQIIVNFLITHDHPYPMLPPSPISRGSGISTDDVLKKMQEAYIKVLNGNIRIN